MALPALYLQQHNFLLLYYSNNWKERFINPAINFFLEMEEYNPVLKQIRDLNLRKDEMMYVGGINERIGRLLHGKQYRSLRSNNRKLFNQRIYPELSSRYSNDIETLVDCLEGIFKGVSGIRKNPDYLKNIFGALKTPPRSRGLIKFVTIEEAGLEERNVEDYELILEEGYQGIGEKVLERLSI